MPDNYKLGLRPKRVSLKTPVLGDFLDRATFWPDVKPRGWEFAVPADKWGMLGNDRYGCCGPAMAAHKIISDTWNTGNPLFPTERQVLDFYRACNPGFREEDDSTDTGVVLMDLLEIWKTDGFPVNDKNGNVVIHKILGWASCDITSIPQMHWACDTFGGLCQGINIPLSAMLNTGNWLFDPKSPRQGGHAILEDGQGHLGSKKVSWGMVIPASNDFDLNTLTECFAVITDTWLNAQGESPSGFDQSGLLEALKKL